MGLIAVDKLIDEDQELQEVIFLGRIKSHSAIGDREKYLEPIEKVT